MPAQQVARISQRPAGSKIRPRLTRQIPKLAKATLESGFKSYAPSASGRVAATGDSPWLKHPGLRALVPLGQYDTKHQINVRSEAYPSLLQGGSTSDSAIPGIRIVARRLSRSFHHGHSNRATSRSCSVAEEIQLYYNPPGQQVTRFFLRFEELPSRLRGFSQVYFRFPDKPTTCPPKPWRRRKTRTN
jgi:hypothetical protein